jgi:choline dehydrogenase-like flavoprotein
MNPIDASTLHGDLSLRCDTVVVGSGASGAVVARILSEAGEDVVVLEEGRHMPGLGHMRRSEVMRHMWREAGVSVALGLGNTPAVNLMVGKGMGGSSLFTGGVCYRTPAHVLDRWAREFGLTDLTPARMEPYFQEVEHALQVVEVPKEMRSQSVHAFDRGATALGYPLKSLHRNTNGCRGCGRCLFVCPHGAKLSVDLSYLPQAEAAGARLYSRCRIDRVATENGRAAGVRGRLPGGGRMEVRARRVVVACGALFTPILLARSGVGRQSRQLGRNLTLHPGFRVFGRFDERLDGWRGAFQSAYSDAFAAERLNLISIYVPPGVFAAQVAGAGAAWLARVAEVGHVAQFGAMLHDLSGGRVHRGLGRAPIVTYRMNAADRALTSRAIRILGDTFLAAGARELYLPIFGMAPLSADAFLRLDLDRIPGHHFECASQHPLGSCRMGTDPKTSVIKEDGESWELPGLYVVDGSVFPTSLGVNPQVSIMAMATRLARRMLASC